MDYIMKKFEEKTTETEVIFEGKIVNLQVDTVELPNGKHSKRELIKHPGAVAIVAITEENKIVLVEQFRKPLEKSIIEIPAGKLEYGEDPVDTGLRELQEETGYEAERLIPITSFYTSPGFANELIHIYLAENITKMENPPPGDEDEFVEIIEVGLAEAKAFVEEQRICDAKTNYAILYLEMMGILK